jgi:hypothetical protein
MIYGEPVLITSFLSGGFTLFIRRSRAGVFLVLWFLAYVAIFYFGFRFDSPFLGPVIPIFALCGGYFLALFWNKKVGVSTCLLVLLILLAASVRTCYIGLSPGEINQHKEQSELLLPARPLKQTRVYLFNFPLFGGTKQ